MDQLELTKTSKYWSELPGNADPLNLMKAVFESDNKYGIPTIIGQDFVPTDLVMYGSEVRRPKKDTWDKTIHFFLDDYKFEPLWNRPIKTLSMIQKIGRALSPDFSLYMNYPRAIQIYNVYRNRWLGRYWQENGIDVIPTIAWSDKESYDYSFLGVEKHSTVAIGTVGLKSKDSRQPFIDGFEEMIRQLEPKNLIVYGEIEPLDFDKYVDQVHRYDSYWAKRRGEISGR